MNDVLHPGLLPAGMHDLLPPEAEVEALCVSRLMAVLAAHGYERVKPPLVEFEDTLFAGAGAAMGSRTFRTMDPASHRMVGVRADMTPQIARIAATRLGHLPRPLRLSYAGQVLRVSGSEIRPERQVGQAGAELIGAAGPAADVEVIGIAGEALAAIGVSELSVDITLPTLVPAIAQAYELPGPLVASLRAVLDHKDVAAVSDLANAAGTKEVGEVLCALLAAAGPAEAARMALERLKLPAGARDEAAPLGAVLDGLAAAVPGLKVTVDPVENRGFEYHTGISFTFFARSDPAKGPLGELGRGGRYVAGDPAAPEPATGFSLYTDTILRTLPEPAPRRRVLLPLGAAQEEGRRLRGEGWITVAAMSGAADWRAEARRLRCTHLLEHGAPVPVQRPAADGG
ncbi:MAG TPA: ATP phosphoribosyltransferase regulatory subunit [Stellaceae bacterium]|nr:ATP phosphoribosyltransferase regulatory subunit [Stellaceae bacterium]